MLFPGTAASLFSIISGKGELDLERFGGITSPVYLNY